MVLGTIFSDILSLLIAFISLIVSAIALLIARRTYIHSSKDYTPNLTYSILNEDTVEIIHKSIELYKIDFVNFLKVEVIGFEDSVNARFVQIPFLTISITYRYIEENGKAKKIVIDKNVHGPCAYGLCPYDENMKNSIREKIYRKYSSENTKGYALPSLQSLFYLIEIVYTDKFQERKSVIFKHEHFHGHGFDKTRITESELHSILEKLRIPKFNSMQLLWKYLLKKYHTNYT